MMFRVDETQTTLLTAAGGTDPQQQQQQQVNYSSSMYTSVSNVSNK